MDGSSAERIDEYAIYRPPRTSLAGLPTELLIQVLTLLDGHSLARILQTSRLFQTLALEERLWQRLVSNLRLTVPAPYNSFRDLYASLHSHLWLHCRLWHSDTPFAGHVAVSRYSPLTGTIDITLILTTQPSTNGTASWSIHPSVLLTKFTPTVKLWDHPVMQLSAASVPDDTGEVTQEADNHGGSAPLYVSLFRARPIAPELLKPSMSLWPPPIIPANDRTRNVSQQGFRGTSHKPQSPEEASKSLFRLRRWMRFKSAVQEGAVETFSALEPEIYTPDVAHPLRGVWVGDYGGHGCELILFHQLSPTRLEGIKLSGDINVPRGEYTFEVPDLEDLIRIADEKEWPGAKVIRAVGQIAQSQFLEPSFTPCQLIWISDDEVALYWILGPSLGHVARYRRVDVNRLLWGDGVQVCNSLGESDPEYYVA